MATPLLNRRHFLALSALGIVGSSAIWHRTEQKSGGVRRVDKTLFFSAHKDNQNHYFSAFDNLGFEQFRLQTPTAFHSLCSDHVRPDIVIGLSRDPGEPAWLVDINNGQKRAEFQPKQDRHFNGHGVISRDGKYFYASQNDFVNEQGKIAKYELATGQQLDEFESGGQGPHEIKLLNQSHELVIANGGVQTHPDSGRKDLNLKSMTSSLAYLDLETGKLNHVAKVPEQQNSIRHIDVTLDDTVAIGLQYKGRRERPALVGFQKGREAIRLAMADEQTHWNMNNYTGSVCVDSNRQVAAITCPRSNLLTFWDIEAGSFIKAIEIFDASGIALHNEADGDPHYIVTSGTGHLVWVNANTLDINTRDSHQKQNYWENAHWGNHLSPLALNPSKDNQNLG